MPEKKIPLGKPLELTDEELAILAEITPDDIQAAKKLWITSVPAEIKSLLDAEVVEE